MRCGNRGGGACGPDRDRRTSYFAAKARQISISAFLPVKAQTQAGGVPAAFAH